MLALGTLGVTYILWRWRREETGPETTDPSGATADPEMRSRLEDELKKFDDRN